MNFDPPVSDDVNERIQYLNREISQNRILIENLRKEQNDIEEDIKREEERARRYELSFDYDDYDLELYQAIRHVRQGIRRKERLLNEKINRANELETRTRMLKDELNNLEVSS